MPTTLRTFIAVEIAEAVRQRAGQLIEQFRAATIGVTWVKPPNMHLTLKFLGDVAEEDLRRVCEAIPPAVVGVRPFELEVRGVGAFPRIDRPTTLWLGGGEGTAEVARLAEQIDAAMRRLRFPREPRAFQPHLTLGRVRRGGEGLAALTKGLRQHADFVAGRTRIEEVVVFSSQLQPTGPIYQPLCRTKLAAE